MSVFCPKRGLLWGALLSPLSSLLSPLSSLLSSCATPSGPTSLFHLLLARDTFWSHISLLLADPPIVYSRMPPSWMGWLLSYRIRGQEEKGEQLIPGGAQCPQAKRHSWRCLGPVPLDPDQNLQRKPVDQEKFLEEASIRWLTNV